MRRTHPLALVLVFFAGCVASQWTRMDVAPTPAHATSTPSVQRWEYYVATTLGSTQTMLNEAGNEGWELVHKDPGMGPYIFKRPAGAVASARQPRPAAALDTFKQAIADDTGCPMTKIKANTKGSLTTLHACGETYVCRKGKELSCEKQEL